MFDTWRNPRTLILRDEPVEVLTNHVWPDALGAMSLAPADVRNHGLYVDAIARGRLLAWVRRSNGVWLAVVQIEGRSRDGQSSLTMTLWVLPNAVRPAR
ncbi:MULTISPECIES: hypothetical protein [Mycobacteriaceae]|uniref:Uncharacterized protein n=1 Tax=Mycolicibacterium fluoranthenivorans TaxID=258505 RepID=A0A1G4W1N2_9MYCO|nr:MULTISPECIES: hypothetical protein [Mycobacteriaceae]SCX15316.1 hypothetical protein SAMN02799620_02035 [Mycolicibacterium fluoranthenivorans]